MKITDVIGFINPFGDALSTTFVALLVLLSIGTVAWLLKSANPTHWEKNWHGDASLDSEHGSVHELSEAVATKAEQVAEIMPSMILIIGLLGTFIGLGIALNSASDVLASANASGMDTAMSNLMTLMEGLGAKFKTSTWGLLCFIVLNVLFNTLGFKEKRLAWAIQKLYQETEAKHKAKEQAETKKYRQLLTVIKTLTTTFQESNVALTQSNQANLSELQKIASYNKATQDAMQQFVDNTVQSMSSIGDSADQMAQAAHTVGTSAHELNAVIDKLQTELKDVMDMIRRDLGDTISNMGENFEQSMTQMADSMSHATQGISTAVTNLANSVNGTMDKVQSIIGESMDLQRKSAQEFTVTSTTLNGQIVEMTNLVQQLSGDITSGLKAVSESGRRMQSLDKKFATNTDQIEAITQTNQELNQILTQLSDKTNTANQTLMGVLDNLDKTVAQMSQDINNSLQQIKPKSGLFS